MPGKPDAASGDTEVHSITDAAAAHSEEMRQRMIKYAVAMGIRMVCLILIFVVDGWFKLLPVAGAVFLPWIAVVIANGSDKAEVHSDSLLDYAPLAELDAPAADGPAPEDREDARGDGETSSRATAAAGRADRRRERRRRRPGTGSFMNLFDLAGNGGGTAGPAGSRLLPEGLPGRRRMAAALEQPQDPHAGAAQDLAGLRGAPGLAGGLPPDARAVEGNRGPLETRQPPTGQDG